MVKKISVGLFATMLLMSGSSLMAAENEADKPVTPGNMGFTELVAQAEYSIANDEPGLAVTYLEEIISRAGTLDQRDAQKSVQMARLQLASSYIKLQRWDKAGKYAQEYLNGSPATDRMAAIQMLCQINNSQKKWIELLTSANMMLAEKPGLKEQAIAEQFMIQALFHLEKYEEASNLLPKVIERTKDADALRSYQIMQLRCLFEAGKIHDLVLSLPQVFRGDVLYDVSLNLTLLRMGDQLFDREQYREALMIYRLVMPKADLLAHQQAKMDALKDSDDKRLRDLRNVLEMLHGVPDYDLHIAYRAAQVYAEQKRFWEAVVLFDNLYVNFPDKPEGEAGFLQKVLLLFKVGADDEAVTDCVTYLDGHRSGLYPRIICTQLVQHYLKIQDYKKALALSAYIDGWKPTADKDERAQEADLRYMLAITRFQLAEYDEAHRAFSKLIQGDPESPVAIESQYWQAMCRLLQQDYAAAYTQFTKYRESWPTASFAPAALYRAGVCRFGLEDYEGAKELFKSFISEYPEDTLMPEAHSMYGDLLGADGEVDLALANYKKAVLLIKKLYGEAEAGVPRKPIVLPATYAILQGAQLIALDAEAFIEQDEPEPAKLKYEQLIDWMNDYIDTFGEDANWAQGVFWIGKAQIALGEAEKAVDAYLDTVITHGSDPSQEGVTSILFDLADMIENKLPIDRYDSKIEAIKDARKKAQSRTLQIRLDVLFAQLNSGSEMLGQELISSENDLSEVPPSGLALMCSAYLENEDYSRAKELFGQFAERYENSLFRAVSYQLQGENLFKQGKMDEAYDMAMEALGMYGGIKETGWAQLMKGRIEIARAEYKKAADSLNVIFSVRAWRGEISAEAMYRLAESWALQGNDEKAFAFFQRTYLLYKAYADGYWAAESYLRTAETLNKMGRKTAARNTYRAMLLDTYVRDLPQAQVAKNILGPEETAELLAGGTNTIEQINLEEIQ